MPEDISKSDKSKLRKTLENVILFVKKHPGECIFCLLLVVFYYIIYFFFRLGIGFSTGPSLDVSDWLSFLSGYLSFAGAAIMAFLVYKQDKKINELMEKEYEPNFIFTLKEAVQSQTSLYDPNNIIDFIKKNTFSRSLFQKKGGAESVSTYSIIKYDAKGASTNDKFIFLKLYFIFTSWSKIPRNISFPDQLAIQLATEINSSEKTVLYRVDDKSQINILQNRKITPSIPYPVVFFLRFPINQNGTCHYCLSICTSTNQGDVEEKIGFDRNYFILISAENGRIIKCTDGACSCEVRQEKVDAKTENMQ